MRFTSEHTDDFQPVRTRENTYDIYRYVGGTQVGKPVYRNLKWGEALRIAAQLREWLVHE